MTDNLFIQVIYNVSNDTTSEFELDFRDEHLYHYSVVINFINGVIGVIGKGL